MSGECALHLVERPGLGEALHGDDVRTVCLIGDPGTCRDHKITLTPGITLIQCLMTAPPHIAKWSEEHPGWHVERWQCGDASREQI